jgi:hypothetical protein
MNEKTLTMRGGLRQMTATHSAAEAGWPRAGRRLVSSLEFGALLVLGLLVHTLVLRFVFPGYYRPFWPFHSDFYIAPELANTPTMPRAILGLPRPVGYGWFYLTGMLGVRGAIAANLVLVCANCAGLAFCVRRLLGIARTWPFWAASAVYLFLIYAHPGQYGEALYDPFSQLSFALLLAGAALGWSRKPLVLQAAAFALGLLAKETYAPAVVIFLAVAWLADAGPGRRHISATIMALGAAGTLYLIHSRLVRSEYVGFGSGRTSPYFVDLDPASVMHQWTAYAAEAGLVFWLYVGLVFVVATWALWPLGRKISLPFAALALTGLVCWLPNSVLPNHHMFGYSWLGASLLLSSVLALPRLWTTGRKALFVGVLALGLAVPAGLHAAYAKNGWLLEQQQRQSRLMAAVGTHIARLAPMTRRVLVTGLDFPFSPFDHPRSLYRYARTLPMFSVVTYEPKQFTLFQKPAPARWITPEEASRETFDEVWMFAEDGAALTFVLTAADKAGLEALGVPAATLPLYPAVPAALGLGDAKSGGSLNLDGYHLLGCGSAYLGYHRYDLALACLTPSAAKIPDNPYPHYFAGLADEKLKRAAAAKAEFLKAEALDDKAKPNRAFAEALQRVSKDAP